MFRRKFKGPVASAAKQIVKNDAAPTTEKPADSEAASTSQAKVSETEPTLPPESIPNKTEELSQPLPPSSPVKPILVDKSKKRTFSGLRSPVRFADDVETTAEPSSVDNVQPRQRTRTISTTSISSSRPTSPMPPKKRIRRIFDKDEELNPSTFTMADLIDFRPKAENNLRKKWKDLEAKFKEEGFACKKEKPEATEQDLGPRVKMDVDGNIIIDEESLVVRRNPEAEVFEAVDDDLLPKKINSLSFKKNYSRATTWSELETELFYDVLSATGTDFSLMNEYLPFKSRQDIKKKFRKEERINLQRINSTLRNPSMLDDELLKKRVNVLMTQIDNDKAAKEALKEKKIGSRRKRKDTLSSVISIATTATSTTTN